MLLLSAPAFAATLTVGPSGTYPTIADAVAAAASGDEIVVATGTYTESVSLTKALTIRGDGDVVWTGAGPLVAVGPISASLRDLTLSPVTGRALTATSSVLALDHVTIDGGEADPDAGISDGGALYLAGGFATLTDCDLADGRALSGSGGLLYASGTSVTIEGGTFTGGRAEKGGAIYVISGALDVTNAGFSANSVRQDDEPGRGGAIRTQDTPVTIQTSAFDGNTARTGFGGHLAVTRGTLRIEDSVVANGSASEYYGGAIVASDAPITLIRTSFDTNTATVETSGGYGHGGAVMVTGSTASLIVQDSTFHANGAVGFGGAIRVEVGDVTIADTTFEANESAFGGAIHLATQGACALAGDTFRGNLGTNGGAIRWRPDSYVGTLTIERSTFTDDRTETYGGALYARTGGALAIRDSAFTGESAQAGGALMLWDIPTLEIERNRFCGNDASVAGPPDGGAATLYQSGIGGTANLWRNNLFLEDVADSYGGALNVLDGGPIVLENNTFAGNTALDSGGHVALRGNDATVRNNAFVGATLGFGLTSDEASTVTETYNAWYDNAGGDLGDGLTAVDPTDLQVAPGFTAWTADGDCGNDDLTLAAGSPLRDAGDPSIVDLDGSRSDIGAYGGPGADPAVVGDEDGDGYAVRDDCDDTDAAAHPGAAEIPYDSVDQDCDGTDLTDVDADGFPATEAGGDDCADDDAGVHPGADDAPYDGVDADCAGGSDFDADADGYDRTPEGPDCADADPAIHPGSTDVAGDGVDQDCDGADAVLDEPGCGCRTAGASPLWAFALILLVRRR